MGTKSVDLSEFLKLSKPKKPACRVGAALEGLPPSERAKLEAALAEDRSVITTGAIVQWLAVRELKVSQSAVISHRHGTCTCHD